MEYKKYAAFFANKKFIIEEDNPDVGFYLYVYKDNVCLKDYLQDSLIMAKENAFEEYGVPIDIWKEI